MWLRLVSFMHTEVSEEYTASVFKETWISVSKWEYWHRNIFVHVLDISFLIRSVLEFVVSSPLILFPFKNVSFTA
jgi:hypothetical protein